MAPLDPEAVDFETFKTMMELAHWAGVEQRFTGPEKP